MSYWIGVDLDGTLAYWEGEWKGFDSIGKPIQPMVDRVKGWLAEGKDVRIFTARLDLDPENTLEDTLKPIEAWCLKHIGQVLPVVDKKDRYLIEYWDDRAVQVELNTGKRLDGVKE